VSGYLDAASAEPLHPAARGVLAEAYDRGWADPLRMYGAGRQARMLLDNARELVAAVLGARADEVVFTSSGTTATHLGVLGLGRSSADDDRPDVVVSAVEHSAVLYAARHRTENDSRRGRVIQVPVDATGQVDASTYAAALTPTAALACLQAANHEVGTVQPVNAVADAARAAGIPLLVDVSQAVGRIGLPDGWSALAADARVWGGPPGVGVLATRRHARFRSPWPEDEHEDGRVPGTPDIPAIVAAATALRARVEEAEAINARHRDLVHRIRTEVPRRIADVDVVGHPTERLPHIVTFSVLYLDGLSLVTALDAAGFAVSSGSSCTSNTLEPSHVLVAMGALTHGNVRVSLSRDTTEEDIDRFLTVLPDLVRRLRQEAGAP
jgi:cysteine desulfurase